MRPKTFRCFLGLLESICEQEASLEYSRQLLCSQTDFEPYAAFQCLDKSHKGYLIPTDIHDFLITNGLSQTIHNVANFLKQFDFDQDQSLVFSEFLKLVLPANNPTLRTIVSQRPTNSKKVSFDVEFSLGRLMNKEINGLMDLEIKKKDLFFNNADFDLKEAFFIIDLRNTGFITFDTLQEFFEQQEVFYSQEQIVNLLKRLDRNDDGKANFEEFKFALLPLDGAVPNSTVVGYNYEKNMERSLNYDKNRESALKYNGIGNRSMNLGEDDLDKSRRKKELMRSFEREKNKSYEKYDEFTSQSRFTKKSFHKEKEPTTNSDHSHFCRKHARPKQDFTQFYFKEQGELARTLKQFILLDRQVEIMKRDLSIREDFELLTIFQIMDYKGKGYLSAYELEDALNKLKVFPGKYELFLFIKRYNREFDGKLSFAGLVESMVPEELRTLVGKRRPIDENGKFEDFSEVLSKETLRLLKELWVLHLENEAASEALRQRLDSRKKFDLEKIFFAIDYDQDGFLDEIDLMKFMENHGIECGDREIDIIIERFDLNLDGKISYSEFLQELTPKSPKKF